MEKSMIDNYCLIFRHIYGDKATNLLCGYWLLCFHPGSLDFRTCNGGFSFSRQLLFIWQEVRKHFPAIVCHASSRIPYAENLSSNVPCTHECIPLFDVFCIAAAFLVAIQFPPPPCQLVLRRAGISEISSMLTIGSNKPSGISLCYFTLVHPVIDKGNTAKCFGA